MCTLGIFIIVKKSVCSCFMSYAKLFYSNGDATIARVRAYNKEVIVYVCTCTFINECFPLKFHAN